MQGICDPGKVLNEASVMPHKPDKTLDGGVCGRFRVFCNGLQIISAGLYPFQGDTMSQGLNFFSEEFTLQRLEFQSMEPEMLQHSSKAFDVFFLHARIYDDFIQIHQAGLII